MALEYRAPRRIAVGIALLAVAGGLAIVPAATEAPDAPSRAYLGGLALQAQEPPAGGELPGRLPYTPTPEQTSVALVMHHPRILARGLPEDRRVWFVIDRDMRILHTGVGPAEGLHARVRSLHPESVSDAVLEISHETEDGLTLRTTWFVPEPPR